MTERQICEKIIEDNGCYSISCSGQFFGANNRGTICPFNNTLCNGDESAVEKAKKWLKDNVKELKNVEWLAQTKSYWSIHEIKWKAFKTRIEGKDIVRVLDHLSELNFNMAFNMTGYYFDTVFYLYTERYGGNTVHRIIDYDDWFYDLIPHTEVDTQTIMNWRLGVVQ